MRWVLGAVLLFALAPSAFADDLDILRGNQTVGPATFPRWSGFYFGAQFGYSDMKADFKNATVDPAGFGLRNTILEQDFMPQDWTVLGDAFKGGVSYGGFVGYSTQWQDLILGLEADFTRTQLTGFAPSYPISRYVTTVDPNTALVTAYNVTASGSAMLQLEEYGSLRMRAGWVFDNYFQPYGFVGAAFGLGDYSRTAAVSWQQNVALPPAVPVLPCIAGVGACANFGFSSTNGQNSVVMYGFDIGGGVDVALTSNIFVRGEYEYVQFAAVGGIVAAISSARLGAGLKF